MHVRWKLKCSRLYGITVLQTYIYYKENPKDLVRVKVLVSVASYSPQKRVSHSLDVDVKVGVVL